MLEKGQDSSTVIILFVFFTELIIVSESIGLKLCRSITSTSRSNSFFKTFEYPEDSVLFCFLGIQISPEDLSILWLIS